MRRTLFLSFFPIVTSAEKNLSSYSACCAYESFRKKCFEFFQCLATPRRAFSLSLLSLPPLPPSYLLAIILYILKKLGIQLMRGRKESLVTLSEREEKSKKERKKEKSYGPAQSIFSKKYGRRGGLRFFFPFFQCRFSLSLFFFFFPFMPRSKPKIASKRERLAAAAAAATRLLLGC